jgi:hypothetical protein
MAQLDTTDVKTDEIGILPCDVTDAGTGIRIGAIGKALPV